MPFKIDPYVYAAGYRYLFDEISGGVGGYCLAKLREAYAGYAVKVRRSSDNATTDVSFDANNMVSGTSAVSAGGDLATWQGAANLFVDTQYDQSGGGWDVTAPSNATQPQLVTSSSPYYLSYSTTQYMDEGTNSNSPPFNFAHTDPFSIIVSLATAGNNIICAREGASGQFQGWNVRILGGVFRTQLVANISGNYLDVSGSTTVNDSTVRFLTMTYDGSSDASGISLYVNGSSETPTVNNNALISAPNYTNTTFKTNGRGNSGSIASGLSKTNSDIFIFDKELSPAEVLTAYEIWTQ